jgi:hypothetical protein
MTTTSRGHFALGWSFISSFLLRRREEVAVPDGVAVFYDK